MLEFMKILAGTDCISKKMLIFASEISIKLKMMMKKDVRKYFIIGLMLVGCCANLPLGLGKGNVCHAAAEGNGMETGYSRCVQQRRNGHRCDDDGRYMSKQEFEVLYAKVKGKSFGDDKLELIEIGSLDSRFACHQCRRIMDLFSFEDEKLEALMLMAPHIVDMENGELIVEALTFESNKEKARKMMMSVRKNNIRQ